MANGDLRKDELSATGERPGLGKSELYAEWASRMQRGRGRHAAISRNLSSWSNYKSWSERMKDSFDTDVTLPRKK
jgi:hypothetical protein